jgi:hypothetical protein
MVINLKLEGKIIRNAIIGRDLYSNGSSMSINLSKAISRALSLKI